MRTSDQTNLVSASMSNHTVSVHFHSSNFLCLCESYPNLNLVQQELEGKGRGEKSAILLGNWYVTSLIL